MEVDESFCHNKNVLQRFAGSSVDQRVPWHWFELSCLVGGEDPLALESLRGGALIFEWRRPATNTHSVLHRVDSFLTCPVYCRTLSSFSSHLMHTMQVIVHCAQICAQPKIHNMLRTLLSHSLTHRCTLYRLNIAVSNLIYFKVWCLLCFTPAHWAIQTELVYQTAH